MRRGGEWSGREGRVREEKINTGEIIEKRETCKVLGNLNW